jgi:hypothetical protein
MKKNLGSGSSCRLLLPKAAGLLGIWGVMALSCTSARENSEYNATTPAAINSDADRKTIYNQGDVSGSPSATPRKLNNQASEINRQKHIERRTPDQPNNRPLEVRTEELGRPAADTVP